MSKYLIKITAGKYDDVYLIESNRSRGEIRLAYNTGVSVLGFDKDRFELTVPNTLTEKEWQKLRGHGLEDHEGWSVPEDGEEFQLENKDIISLYMFIALVGNQELVYNHLEFSSLELYGNSSV